jgi:hypothetical protein
MFSKEEALQIKKDFWIAFAAEYPRKWLLYNTKIKDVTFKFYVDNKKAQVLLDIEPKDEEKRKIYYEKVESLKNILLEEYLEDAIFERNFYLENGKGTTRKYDPHTDMQAKTNVVADLLKANMQGQYLSFNGSAGSVVASDQNKTLARTA